MRDIINKINEASNIFENIGLDDEDAATLADASMTYVKVGSISITADTTDAEVDALVNKLVGNLWGTTA